MTTLSYYPSLDTLISLENIPTQLGVVKEGLSNLFSHLFYRDLQIHKTVEGDAVFYSLSLVTYKRLALEVPGTGGLALILNPSLDEGVQGAHSEFPISISYKWSLLKYAKDFDLQSFDFSGPAFFNLILDLTGVTKQELLTEALSVLTDDPDPIQQFIDLFNNDPNYNPLAPLELHSFPTDEEVIADLLMQLITNGNDFDSHQIILDHYVASFNSFGDAFDKIERLFKRWLGGFSIDNIKELLIPQVSASIDALSIGIQFPGTILREVDANGDPVPDPQNAGADKPTLLTFDVASLKYSTASGLEFDLAESLNINFPKSEILRSGLMLELHDLKIDLSRTTNIAEANADGRPVDFVGVYVKDGTISFPAFWNHDPNSTGVVKAMGLIAGTGGLTGIFSLEAKDGLDPAPLISCKFGDNFSVSLDAFSITLKHNAIIDSKIEGTLMIPGFKDANDNPAEIRIKVDIRPDGDFDITAHEDDGFKEIKCGDIFSINLKSVYFGKSDDDFYLGVSGSIKFTHALLSGIDDIEVEKLIIYSDGRFEIPQGGTIPLPQNISFPIGPAELSISSISLGSYKRINADATTTDFRYFGFGCVFDMNPGGVDLRGNGIKFFFPVNGDLSLCYLEIKRLEIDLVLPGNASKETATLLMSGFLSVGGTSSDPEYEGGISFRLPKVKIAGAASLKYKPKDPSFIAEVAIELSTPLPLAATGLGTYAFAGLFGQRYVPDKNETDTWFDYYKGPPSEGISVSKFKTPDETKNYDNPFSIGAGVSLATLEGSGQAFSCKLFLLLSLPDMVYLEGKAKILGPRVALKEEDPPFFAMLAINSQSVELGAGVDYKLPREGAKKGQILEMNAEMRAAFFFQNSSAWFINIGTMENPTTAHALGLFRATSYLMISAAGIAAGAGVTYGFEKSYAGGVVRASVDVYIKVGGSISFERAQIGGFAMLGGHVDVSLMWVSFYLGIDTSLSVEAPRPFYVQGKVHLCVGITIGFWKFKKTFEYCFDVEFKWEKDSTVDTSPVLPFKDLGADPTAPPPLKATNMLSGESFNIVFLGTSLPSADAPSFDQAVLPLDSRIHMEFLKGLRPGLDVDERIGRLSGQAPSNTIDYVPPAEVPHRVKHEYSIKKIKMKAWDGNTWVDYRPFQAMSPPAALAALGANPSAYKDGFWQNSGAGFNKLCLLAETSFSYMEQGEPGWYVPEQFGITSATLFCSTSLRDEHCIDWGDITPGTVYSDGVWQQINTVLCRVSGGPGTVIDWNSHFGIPRSLVFSNEATAQIVFNKPSVKVNLKLTTFSSGVVIRFYKRETVGAGFVYTLVETRTLTQLQLLAQVQYNSLTVPVAKVEIDPINADPATVYRLQVQIEALYRQLYESKLDAKRKAALVAKILELERELARIIGRGCMPNGIDKETAQEQLPVLQQQVEECRKQLAALQAAQKKVCGKVADFQALFGRCFPKPPSLLSYEVVEDRKVAGHPKFQFRVYDDQTDSVLLNSAKQYPDAAKAESAMFDTLELALRPEAYALMTAKNRRYFFQIVDASHGVRAVSPALFSTQKQRNAFVAQMQATLRAAHAGGKFTLARRVAGKLPCEERLDHLDCWKELSVFGGINARLCQTIVARLLSAHDVYCNQYNKLYRELYECNKKLLDQVTRRCDEMTHEMEIKLAACQVLSDQLEAIQQLTSFIDKNGELLPPEGFPCSTLLHEACCLSLEDYQFNISVPGQAAVEQDYENAVQAIQKWLTPTLRPDTKYCIHLQVTDTVNDGASTDNDFYFGFRTAGPPPLFHKDSSANYVDVANGKTPDQYMLTDLKGYIDYRRSYPPPDGQLIGTKPLFYEDARILLFFTKRYVFNFFSDWPAYNGLPAITGNEMQVVIIDPAQNISIPNPPPPQVTTTEIPQAIVSWQTDDDPRIPEDIRTLLNLRNPELLNPDFVGGDCWKSGGDMIKPASVYAKVTLQYLEPLKLYMAIINNVYRGQAHEAHSFVFSTSRYADFSAQVNSYHLDDGKGNQRDAIFRIDVPLLKSDIKLMYDIVTGNMSVPNAALAVTWAHPFDRLVEGVMKLAPLDVAVSTEFNIIRNSKTNAVVGVLIRCPEPFNPQLPEDVLKRSLRVMNGLNPDPDYEVLFSKDRSQAFVMHRFKVIPVTQMKFRFTYIEWNGSDYVDHKVVMTGVIHTNV